MTLSYLADIIIVAGFIGILAAMAGYLIAHISEVIIDWVSELRRKRREGKNNEGTASGS